MKTFCLFLLFVGIPFFVESIQVKIWKINFKSKDVLQKILLEFIFAIIAPVCATYIFYLAVNRYSWYEYLLLESFFSIALSLIIIPLLHKEKLDHIVILKFLCFISISIALYSALTYTQTNIHSDTASATYLANSILKYKSLFPKSWCYPNGELLVIGSYTVTLPFSIFMNNQPLARACGSAVLIIFTVLSLRFLSKKIFSNESWYIVIPFILIFVGASKCESRDMILWQAAYIPNVIWFSLLLPIFYEIYTNNLKHINKYKMIFFIFFVFILSLGGVRMIAEFVLPLFLTVFFLLCLENPNKFEKSGIKKFVCSSCLILIPAFIGFYSPCLV